VNPARKQWTDGGRRFSGDLCPSGWLDRYHSGFSNPTVSVRELFEANLAVIERAIEAVCAQASLRGADAEDFASLIRRLPVD